MISRSRQHLVAATKLYPGAWRQADAFRAGRGRDLPDWPDWCYLPLAAWYAIISADAGIARLSPALAGDVGRLGALGTWRMTQGVYRFDPALYADLIVTPVAGDLPHDVLYRLPEWCVYVETPGLLHLGKPLHGFFAHLEHDANCGRPELRLLLDGEAALTPVPIHLGAWSLSEAIARMTDVSRVQALAFPGVDISTAGVTAELSIWVEPLVSLLLYLCTQNAEIGDGVHPPRNPQPRRTKQGWRLFPPDNITTWDVGVRLGAALRRAYYAAETAQGGTHGVPRGHIRRAHWHGYWSGPKEDMVSRRFDLRWMPPIPVNLSSPDDLPTTVHPVK